MRATIKLEMIGVGASERYRAYLGINKSKPWVARILGLDDEWGFERQFMRGYTDYSKASGTGARGVYVHYALEPGIYEVNRRMSWKHVRRYFIHVFDDGSYAEIIREEVIQCLTSNTSA